jgi:hypothetical protein
MLVLRPVCLKSQPIDHADTLEQLQLHFQQTNLKPNRILTACVCAVGNTALAATVGTAECTVLC